MSSTEKHQFQAEIQELLNIVIHSLYTDKEIFVRELISNAADACEKLRFRQASGEQVHEPEKPLGISIATNETEKTITFTDSGIGMTHGEMVENLGTIAHSGTKAFLKQLAEDKKPDAKLIGQFGVGFYSAFMVADKVVVTSRSFLPGEQGWKWTSSGTGGYEIEPAADLPRGTSITVHLKADADEFSKEGKVEGIIKRYSNFVQFPIELNAKRVNTVQAIWARNKNEVKEEEYTEFYKYVGHDQEQPLFRLHFSADAPLAIQALLFVPAKNWETMGLGRTEPEVHLYCKKVLIESRPKDLLPEWLRFLKGVVDSEDLPLNISRERMQDSALIKKLNNVLSNRFIKFLQEQSEKEAEQYQKFYAEYKRFIKEGIIHDFEHRHSLAKLLRFESSITEAGKETTLAEYVSRMQADQKEIYYLMAPTREAAEASAYYEVFKARKIEVLFLYDPWDEFVMDHLAEFDGKDLKAAEKAQVKVEEKASAALDEEKSKSLAAWMKEVLGDKVQAVKASERLVESPAVVVDADQYMTASMRRIMRSMKGNTLPSATYDLEINTAHPVITKLESMRQADSALAGKVAEQVLDNARLAAGLIEDPRVMLKRMNELLEQMLASK